MSLGMSSVDACRAQFNRMRGVGSDDTQLLHVHTSKTDDFKSWTTRNIMNAHSRYMSTTMQTGSSGWSRRALELHEHGTLQRRMSAKSWIWNCLVKSLKLPRCAWDMDSHSGCQTPSDLAELTFT